MRIESKDTSFSQTCGAIGLLFLIFALTAVLPKSVLSQGGPLPFPWWQHVIDFTVSACFFAGGWWVDFGRN
jgi:hypothetical protein